MTLTPTPLQAPTVAPVTEPSDTGKAKNLLEGIASDKDHRGTGHDLTRDTKMDFVKGVMIVLMVSFHYDAIGTVAVYNEAFRWFSLSFFLPILFFLSGYFTKPPRSLTTGVARVASTLGVPYFFFLVVYLGLISAARETGIYPIRQTVQLDATGWLYTVFVSPVGPYYYLYSLAVFRVTYYIAWRVTAGEETQRWAVHLAMLIGLSMSPICTAFWWVMCLGLLWREKGLGFLHGRTAVLPCLVVCCGFFTSNGKTFFGFVSQNAGLHAVWLLSTLSVTLWIHDRCGIAIRRAFALCGRNTLSILVMHIFVLKGVLLCTKWVVSTDPSGVLNILIGATLGTAIPILAAKVLDTVRLTWLMFGRRQVYVA